MRMRAGLILVALMAPFALACSSGSDPQSVSAPPPGETKCLALSMYWEAKAEGRDGMRAVGHVVMNRVADPRFPGDPCAVVYDGGEDPPCQFSWYCDGKSDRPTELEHWAVAEELASQLAAGRLRDTTRGALFFHSARIDRPWKVERERTKRIGRHVFYR